MPEISVIIPVYNPNSGWLIDAVDSIISQGTDFEIIIVDDGSEFAEIIQPFEEYDSRIKVIRHDKNLNQASAMNTGLKNAKGKYICFLDYDDMFIEGKLDKQLTFMKTHSDVDMIYADGYYLKNGNASDYNLNGNPTNLLEWNCICVGSVMVKKEVFDKVGLFDTNLNRSHDWDMWVRIFKAGFDIHHMNERCGIYYRIHDKQKSTLINSDEAHKYIKERHGLK